MFLLLLLRPESIAFPYRVCVQVQCVTAPVHYVGGKERAGRLRKLTWGGIFYVAVGAVVNLQSRLARYQRNNPGRAEPSLYFLPVI
jgi:hypothetical protein